MPLGWIDFSRSDRDKVLNVLELLSEQGTLDELGIAPIRDGFADIFFRRIRLGDERSHLMIILDYRKRLGFPVVDPSVEHPLEEFKSVVREVIAARQV